MASSILQDDWKMAHGHNHLQCCGPCGEPSFYFMFFPHTSFHVNVSVLGRPWVLWATQVYRARDSGSQNVHQRQGHLVPTENSTKRDNELKWKKLSLSTEEIEEIGKNTTFEFGMHLLIPEWQMRKLNTCLQQHEVLFEADQP